MSNIKEEFITNQMKEFENAKRDILEFIANVRYIDGTENTTIRDLCKGLGCYYFAATLELAFQRGMLCYHSPEDRIVWLDGVDSDNDIAYDIDGVVTGYDKRELVPTEEIENWIWKFKHVPGKEPSMSMSELEVCLRAWKVSDFSYKESGAATPKLI